MTKNFKFAVSKDKNIHFNIILDLLIYHSERINWLKKKLKKYYFDDCFTLKLRSININVWLQLFILQPFFNFFCN